jgi:hypothetical protein
MEFELFMKSEEFKDFHDYFHCSRNNKYKFTKDKFETTLEYYQHMYNIKEIDINECLEIFKKHDIAIVPRERIRFYSYFEGNDVITNDVIKEDNKKYDDYELYDDDFNVKKTVHIFKKIEGNIPVIFKKSIRYYNMLDDIDDDSSISYDCFSGEENASESSENEELF